MTLEQHLAQLDADAAAAGFEACGPALARLARDRGCLAAPLNAALEAVLSRPGYSPREVAVQHRADGCRIATQMPLAARAEYTLVLCVHHAASKHAFTAPGDLHVALLGEEPLEYRLFDLPPGHRNDVFTRSRLEARGRGALRPAEPLFVDARRTIAVFEERPAVLLKLESRRLLPYEWAFDLASLEPWQVSSTSLEDTQLVYAAQAFAALGDAAALEPLGAMLRHPRHHVRWAAMRAYARLAGAGVRPCLERALEDPHPQVREAARKALARAGPAAA